MKLDIGIFKVQKPALKLYLDKWRGRDAFVLCSEFSSFSSLPILVTLLYMKELEGSSEKLEREIESLKTFYAITEIVGE